MRVLILAATLALSAVSAQAQVAPPHTPIPPMRAVLEAAQACAAQKDVIMPLPLRAGAPATPTRTTPLTDTEKEIIKECMAAANASMN